MATMLAVMVFGTALAGAAWAIFATIQPEVARIGDLLRHGPVPGVEPPRQVAVRSATRDFRLRSAPVRSTLRAAA
jgi:hypothetical protein